MTGKKLKKSRSQDVEPGSNERATSDPETNNQPNMKGRQLNKQFTENDKTIN